VTEDVVVYDTTLRDGAQAEDISFSLSDKLAITEKLDFLGIHYIEGGWPGANKKDTEYFKEVKKLKINKSTVVAFGSTRRPNQAVEKDKMIRALLRAETPVITVVGKSSLMQVKEALRTEADENLKMIYDTISFLKRRVEKVFFDAEHFFDGLKFDKEYALKTITVAEEAGADCIVLCDTNGGSMPWEVAEAIESVKKRIKVPIGIHAHNDTGMAVANSCIAVQYGARHVQGTINGIGERCGNADLCSIIPNLQLKMGFRCIDDEALKNLREVSIFVYETANLPPNKRAPYVGESAFAHKGGLHIDGITKNPMTYEHIPPEKVGQKRKILVSELSGKTTLLRKAEEWGLDFKKNPAILPKLINLLKKKEHEGYQYENAEASLEILIKKYLKQHRKFFKLKSFRVIDDKRRETGAPFSEATVMVEVDGKIEHTVAEGNGPVNALDKALRKALEKFYPELKEVKLKDFKVRVLTESEGTAAKVRVIIESGDGKRRWGTVGVSHNIIEASWQALVDSIDYKLYLERELKKK